MIPGHSLIGSVHVLNAFAALGLGGYVVLARKGTPLHRLVGLAYVFSMLLVNISALADYKMTGRFGPFHAAAIFSLGCVLLGLTAPILRRPGWLKAHYRWMGWSYFGLLAAAFAETMVRVPYLRPRTISAGFAVAIGASLVFSLLGGVFMRRLGRSLPPSARAARQGI